MKFLIALVGLLAGTLSLNAADVPMVYVNHPSIHPGHTLKIQFPKRGDEPPVCTLGTTTYIFSETPDHLWRTLIAIPVNMEPGPQTIEIDMHNLLMDFRPGPVKLEILPSQFGKEEIRFNNNKSKLLNDVREETESQEIREELKQSSKDPIQRWRGLFAAPVPGIVISKFGIARDKVGQKIKDFHKGVDLAAREGDPIRAANDGEVILVKEYYFHGRTVLINHGQGVATIYLHMKSFDVKEGDHVRRGQKIGEIGASGLATGPHLHWGLYVHGQAVNPMQWLEEEF